VKDGVDFPGRGKAEFESDVMNTSENRERAIVTGGKFGGGVGGAKVFAFEPD
jgi:hypothetical protein